jgi:hypothetical protein
MRTSFHHQPEAQHPNFPLSTSCRPITPSLAHFADSSRTSREVREVLPLADIRPRLSSAVTVESSITLLRELQRAVRKGTGVTGE